MMPEEWIVAAQAAIADRARPRPDLIEAILAAVLPLVLRDMLDQGVPDKPVWKAGAEAGWDATADQIWGAMLRAYARDRLGLEIAH